MVEAKVIVTFLLNGESLKNKPLFLSYSLKDVRNIINLQNDIFFLKNNHPCDKEDENDIKLGQIIEGEYVNLKQEIKKKNQED